MARTIRFKQAKSSLAGRRSVLRARGLTVYLRALRHTFGTHLRRNGVPPGTAQTAMRHSSLDLTMNVSTDPVLQDVAEALSSLPDLAMDAGVEADAMQAAHSPVRPLYARAIATPEVSTPGCGAGS